MTKRAAQVLVGDLLVKAELITLPQLAEAMSVANTTNAPVGRVLVAAGYLTEDDLRHVITVQSMIRDHQLSESDAIAALHLCHDSKTGLINALRQLGWAKQDLESKDVLHLDTRLGDLLIEAEVLQSYELDRLLLMGISTGLPLAKLLVLQGHITDQIAYLMLSGQNLLRDGKIARQVLIDCIKSAMTSRADGTLSERGVSVDEMQSLISQAASVRLGELLVLADLITRDSLMEIFEDGSLAERPLGQVILDKGLIEPELLKQTLAVQEMLNNHRITFDNAIYVLKSVKQNRNYQTDAIRQTDHPPMDLKKRMALACGLSEPFDEATSERLSALAQKVKDGEIDLDQAIFALQATAIPGCLIF